MITREIALDVSKRNLQAFNLQFMKQHYGFMYDHLTLQSLNLSENQLATTEGLSQFYNLKQLDLGFNQIAFFYSLPDQLEYLNLSHNCFDCLFIRMGRNSKAISIFQNLSNLQTLVMNHNMISSLQSEIFNKNQKLEWIDFSNNEIQTNFYCFAFLENLTYLNLSYNKIEDSKPFKVFYGQESQIQELDLSFNPIEKNLQQSESKIREFIGGQVCVRFSANQQLAAVSGSRQESLNQTQVFDHNQSEIIFNQRLKEQRKSETNLNQIPYLGILNSNRGSQKSNFQHYLALPVDRVNDRRHNFKEEIGNIFNDSFEEGLSNLNHKQTKKAKSQFRGFNENNDTFVIGSQKDSSQAFHEQGIRQSGNKTNCIQSKSPISRKIVISNTEAPNTPLLKEPNTSRIYDHDQFSKLNLMTQLNFKENINPNQYQNTQCSLEEPANTAPNSVLRNQYHDDISQLVNGQIPLQLDFNDESQTEIQILKCENTLLQREKENLQYEFDQVSKKLQQFSDLVDKRLNIAESRETQKVSFVQETNQKLVDWIKYLLSSDQLKSEEFSQFFLSSFLMNFQGGTVFQMDTIEQVIKLRSEAKSGDSPFIQYEEYTDLNQFLNE